MKIKKWLIGFAILGLFVAVAITFSGCNGGGDNPAGPSEPIDEKLLIGKWQRQLQGNEGSPPKIEEYRADYVYIWYWDSMQIKGTWRIENGNILVTKSEGRSSSEYRRTIVSLSEEKLQLGGVIYYRV